MYLRRFVLGKTSLLMNRELELMILMDPSNLRYSTILSVLVATLGIEKVKPAIQRVT